MYTVDYPIKEHNIQNFKIVYCYPSLIDNFKWKKSFIVIHHDRPTTTFDFFNKKNIFLDDVIVCLLDDSRYMVKLS